MWYYMRPVGDATQFSDSQDYVEIPTNPPDGFEYIAGHPPEGAIPYVHRTLGDNLKAFLLAQIEAHEADIDPYTESKIRQLQKTIEPLPAEMDADRFVVAMRQEIENFPLPDVQVLKDIRDAMLAMLPE